MIRKTIIISTICFVCTCFTACADLNIAEGQRLDLNDNNDNATKEIVDNGSVDEYEEVNINEEIDDNLFIQAEIKIPTREIGIYETELKQFDCDIIKDILFDNPDKVVVSEDGRYISGESELYASDGCLGYIKSSGIGYIDLLYSYAENKNELNSSELEFETIEEAMDQAEAVLSNLNMGCSHTVPQAYSLSLDELEDLQSEIELDDDYSGMIEAKNLVGKEFGSKSGYYYLEYTFDLEGMNIYGPGDYGNFEQGFDDAELAQDMSITIVISENGIEELTISGAVAPEELIEKDKIIGYEKIKESIIDYYADEILACECSFNCFSLMYMPIIDADSFTSVTLTPVWKCNVVYTIEGEEYENTMYINAVNGDVL